MSAQLQDRAHRQAWFKSVILPHEAALRRYVRRMANSSGVDIDDIVAESLIRAYTTTDYARIEKGATFLFTIARNFLADLARRRAVVSFELMANLDRLELVDESPQPEAVAVAHQEVQRLQQIVNAMPRHLSRILLLRRVDDLSPDDIAAKLGLSVSTIEKHLSRAIAYLTESLSQEGPVSRKTKGLPWRSVARKR